MARHSTPKKPAPRDWHRADIKAALEKAGWSIRGLAEQHQLHHRTLTIALERRYPASERRIAEAIHLHPMVIWPSRYHEDGTPNGRRGNPNRIAKPSRAANRSTRRAAGHVQKRGSN